LLSFLLLLPLIYYCQCFTSSPCTRASNMDGSGRVGLGTHVLRNKEASSLFQRKLSFRIKTTLYVCFIVRPQFWMLIIGSTDYQSIKSVPLRLCVSFLMASAILNFSLPKKTGFEVKKWERRKKVGEGRV